MYLTFAVPRKNFNLFGPSAEEIKKRKSKFQHLEKLEKNEYYKESQRRKQ